MTAGGRAPGPTAALALVAMAALVACSTTATADGTPAGEPAPASRTGSGTGSPDDAPTPAAPAALRDGDITDIDQLAAALATTATGDPAWVDVVSELRARSWLATRYPGRYDLDRIYGEDAAEVAWANEEQSLALGVYLDEPLPQLVSVTKTRDLGELVEVEVVLDAGPATVRGDDDDLPRGVLPGGTHRGLFTLGRDGPGDAWRIHSVTELLVGSRTTGQEPQ